MMKTEITADEIVSLLHALGYRASYELNDINLIVSSASQGFEWYIHISVTEESEASDFLIFSHTRLVSPVLFPVGKICNQFNIISPNGVATFRMDDNHDLTEDVMISLDFSVSLTGGVADEWLEDSISMWDYILGTFDRTVRECEEPAATDKPF
jgi:hypothetical protein